MTTRCASRGAECGRVSDDHADGWEAWLTVDDEVAMFCAECAEREFGSAAE